MENSYQSVDNTFYKQWYKNSNKSAAFKKVMIFRQDNSPPNASDYSAPFLK